MQLYLSLKNRFGFLLKRYLQAAVLFMNLAIKSTNRLHVQMFLTSSQCFINIFTVSKNTNALTHHWFCKPQTQNTSLLFNLLLLIIEIFLSIIEKRHLFSKEINLTFSSLEEKICYDIIWEFWFNDRKIYNEKNILN